MLKEYFMFSFKKSRGLHWHGILRPILLVILSSFTLTACAATERTAMRFLDTSEHHTYTGIILARQEKFDDAEREFSLALQLNCESALANAGMSIVKSQKGDFEAAVEHMELAERFARSSTERLYVHTLKIQLYAMTRRPENWIELAEEEYRRAVTISPRFSAAHYCMGLARMMNHEFDEAGRLFIKVLDLNDEYLEQADREWKRIQMILEAEPANHRIEEIALVDRVTRSQLALILVDQLKLDELYHGLGIYNASLKKESHLLDVEYHPHKREIEVVVDMNVAGLEPYPDGTFHPDDLVTRLALAVVVYDIMVRVSGDKLLAERYGDLLEPTETADFPHSNYDAIRTAVGRGIMPDEWFTSSRLAPYSPVSGAEALLVVKNLKDVLLIGF